MVLLYKMHIGADDISGAVHSLETTAANVHDVTAADQLVHGEETRVWGDAGYRCINKRDEHKNTQVDWYIAMRTGQDKQLATDDTREKIEQQKKPLGLWWSLHCAT